MDAKQQFEQFCKEHDQADICVCIENARGSDYNEEQSEFWEIALDSAKQQVARYIEEQE